MNLHLHGKSLKHWRLLLSMASILLLSGLLFKPAFADGNVAFVKYQFSSTKIYQGNSNVYVDLEITNDGNSSLVLHGAFVHFDWQALDEFYIEGSQGANQLFDLNKVLAPTERHTFRIKFSVSTSVIEGGHAFYFKVFYNNGSEAQWNPRSQDPFAELTVFNMYEPLYNNLVTTVEDKVLQARGAGFISPDARALVQRAEDYLDEAYSYVEQERWQSAVSRLNSVSNLVGQAYTAEQTFRTYLMIGLVIVGIAAVIGIGLFLRRRKKRSTKLNSEKVA